jgi:hypothetical protein
VFERDFGFPPGPVQKIPRNFQRAAGRGSDVVPLTARLGLQIAERVASPVRGPLIGECDSATAIEVSALPDDKTSMSLRKTRDCRQPLAGTEGIFIGIPAQWNAEELIFDAQNTKDVLGQTTLLSHSERPFQICAVRSQDSLVFPESPLRSLR